MSISVEKIFINEQVLISSLVQKEKKTLENFLQENLENNKKNFLKKEVVVLSNGNSLVVELSSRAKNLRDQNISLRGFDPFEEYRQKLFLNLSEKLATKEIIQ